MNPALLPPRVQIYQALVEQHAAGFGLRPELVAAIGDRETLWGTSPDLDKPGPSGTGDFGKRDPKRWGSALPPDGRGWGRGLMQVDFGGHRDWCLQKAPDGRFLWEVPDENVKMGCGILHAAQTALADAAGPHVEAAMACAYNAGAGAAFRALGTALAQRRDPLACLDEVTTGGDYCSWVLARRDLFAGESLPR